MSKAEPISTHDDTALFRDAVRFTAEASGFAQADRGSVETSAARTGFWGIRPGAGV